MKYLITGGAGFIGSHLSEYLLEKDHSVTIIDDLSTGQEKNIQHLIKNNKFKSVFDTIENLKLIDDLASKADFIIHLAAAVGVKLIIERPIHTLQTNIKGTEIILGCAQKYNVPIFLASTSEVYGKLNETPFSEESDCLYGPTTKSRWSYAVSKAVDEYLGLAYHQQNNLKVVIGRFFNTVGPRQVGHYGMVVPRFIKAALKDEDLIVYGDGSQSRCFGYVKEAIEAIYRLTTNPNSFGEIFTIGSNNEITIFSLAETIISHLNSKSKIKTIPFSEVYGSGFEDMSRRVPNTNKLKKIINFSFSTSINEIISETASYIKKEEL